jgi:signal transduction histidine kinase
MERWHDVERGSVWQHDTATVDLLYEITIGWSLTQPDSAVVYGRRALALAERRGYKRGVMLACRALCLGLYMRGDHDDALTFGFRSMRLCDTLQVPRERVISASYVNLVYEILGKRTESLRLFEETRSVAEGFLHSTATTRPTREDSLAVMQVYILGVYPLSEAGQIEKAIHYGTLGVDVARRLGIRYWAWLGTGMIADQYGSLGRIEEGIRVTRTVLAEAQAEDDRYFTSLFFGNLALLETQRGRYKQAIPLYLESIEVGRNNGMRMEFPRIYHEVAAAYHEIGNNAQAYLWEQRAKLLQDSIYTERSTRRVAEMQTRYETEKKEQQIQLLESESRTQTTLRTALVGGLVMVVALLLVSLVAYRQKRRSEAALTAENEKIARLNNDLNAANTRLRDLNDEKNEFLGIAAHDLINPLSGIRSMMQAIAEGRVRDQQRITETASMTYRAADRMTQIVRQFLDINRIESGAALLKPVVFDIVPRVRVVLDDFADRAEAKHITLHYAPAMPCIFVYADKNAVHQVIENLLSNALKFSSARSNVWVNIGCNNKQVCISVRDEGPGLTTEDKSQLFGKFVRLSSQPTGGEHSTGLGLAIVKQLVEAMDGHVRCESVLGNGATFIVELPLSHSASHSAPSSAA